MSTTSGICSYGGLIARLYAHTYPTDVAGMVLVDSPISTLPEKPAWPMVALVVAVVCALPQAATTGVRARKANAPAANRGADPNHRP